METTETMTPVEVVALLSKNDIPVVIIGGVAMRLHRSTRVTQDLDLSIPSTAIDRVVGVLYARDYVIVSSVNDRSAGLLSSIPEANRWIEAYHPGSLTFVARPMGFRTGSSREVPHHAIDIESQVDVLYDLAVPFGRLFHEACTISIGEVTVRYAAAHHLLQLKEARTDRSGADDADIAFLRELPDRDDSHPEPST